MSFGCSLDSLLYAAAARTGLDVPIVLTQLPGGDAASHASSADRARVTEYGRGGRIVLAAADGSVQNLTEGFESACDPAVSFDAKRMLFAARRTAGDPWDIFEMAIDGREVRQITRDLGDCRSPCYQSTLYTIVSPAPWYQLTFVRTEPGCVGEDGLSPLTSLYSCKLDGSAVRRLTYNLSGDRDPFLMYDGRLLFAGRQRAGLARGPAGRDCLFGVNLDGTDFALYSEAGPALVKHMPCAAGDLAIFVESESPAWDGSGTLGSVTIRRPLHTYRPVTRAADGLFHSPSPLPDGRVLVSRRSLDGKDTHGVYVLDPVSGKYEQVFDDPQWHDVQAKALTPRPEPDGRSSVVSEEDPNGRLYCLSVYINDLKAPAELAPGSARRLRVLEGLALKGQPTANTSSNDRAAGGQHGIPVLAQRRLLGEIDIEKDGSFNIEVPANTPIELQLLDEDGMAMRTCNWIWAKNHEPRGCIGCHEDPELTPENVVPDALNKKSIPLTLPLQERRTVDFRRDVMPVLAGKCTACHTDKHPSLALRGAQTQTYNRAYHTLLAGVSSSVTGRGRYVHPGRARTSPLVWRIMGRNTSRPWDATGGSAGIRPMPPAGAEPLTDGEKRTLVEWIDLGAVWSGIPEPAQAPATGTDVERKDK